MLGTMSHPKLISSSHVPDSNANSLLDNGNSLADDFLAHEGMISTVLGDYMKDSNAAIIGEKQDKSALVGWGAMMEQVMRILFIFFVLLLVTNNEK